MEPKYRDLAAESVYEYGGARGVWRLQRLFEQFGIPITFFGARSRSSATPRSPRG